MQAQQILRESMMMEEFFKISNLCIKTCHTLGKFDLTDQDAICLQNCGYNFMFVKMNMHRVMQKVSDKLTNYESDI